MSKTTGALVVTAFVVAFILELSFSFLGVAVDAELTGMTGIAAVMAYLMWFQLP